MSKLLVSDALWSLVAPLLPPEQPKPQGGRPRIADRAALTGIVFVLKSGIPWEMLPQELGCGSGMTCWRRLRDWQHAGVWKRLHQALLQRLQDAGQIDWERASLDSASVPAPRGGEATGKDPTNRAKLGTKRHVVVDRKGVPLAVTISGANVHDSQLLEETVDTIPPLRLPHRQRGRPRKRPTKLRADKGYDYARCRRALRARSIIPRIARRGIESSERLGRYRWVVERVQAGEVRWLGDLLKIQKGARFEVALVNALTRLGIPVLFGGEIEREGQLGGPATPGVDLIALDLQSRRATVISLKAAVHSPSDREVSQLLEGVNGLAAELPGWTVFGILACRAPASELGGFARRTDVRVWGREDLETIASAEGPEAIRHLLWLPPWLSRADAWSYLLGHTTPFGHGPDQSFGTEVTGNAWGTRGATAPHVRPAGRAVGCLTAVATRP